MPLLSQTRQLFTLLLTDLRETPSRSGPVSYFLQPLASATAAATGTLMLVDALGVGIPMWMGTLIEVYLSAVLFAVVYALALPCWLWWVGWRLMAPVSRTAEPAPFGWAVRVCSAEMAYWSVFVCLCAVGLWTRPLWGNEAELTTLIAAVPKWLFAATALAFLMYQAQRSRIQTLRDNEIYGSPSRALRARWAASLLIISIILVLALLAA